MQKSGNALLNNSFVILCYTQINGIILRKSGRKRIKASEIQVWQKITMKEKKSKNAKTSQREEEGTEENGIT